MYIYDTITGCNKRFATWNAAYDYWFSSSYVGRFMYFVKNLLNGAVIPFQNQIEVLKWWQKNVKYDDYLNITGKDYIVRVDFEHDCKKIRYLRPYMVLDANGRTVDIRLWNQTIPADPPYEYSLCWSGHKRHGHRKNGPSMYHHDIAVNAGMTETSAHYRDRTKHIDTWDYIEDAHATNYTSSKCWKDQCRHPKQYMRHKKHIGPKLVKKTTEDGLALAARLNRELTANREGSHDPSIDFLKAS